MEGKLNCLLVLDMFNIMFLINDHVKVCVCLCDVSPWAAEAGFSWRAGLSKVLSHTCSASSWMKVAGCQSFNA